MKTSSTRLQLSLSHGDYPILVGHGLAKHLISFIRTRKSKKVVLISDRRLKTARLSLGKELKAAGFDFSEIVLRAGEALKEIESVYPLYGKLLKMKADRDTLILALGGGSIGDAVGFVAATYLRGVDWVGLPTTLLAQVDSAVGGKTGINHGQGKNVIGAFHQPKLVLCDLNFLVTLGPRERVSGLGEMLKYAFVYDPKLFNQLSLNISKHGELDSRFLQKAVESSLRLKIKAVSADELDRNGVREVLNFGHTFGHALETLTSYSRFQHGEAVIWGMRFALALSLVRKHLSPSDFDQMKDLLARFQIPALPKKVHPALYFQAMKRDKKSSQGQIRFVLLSGLGQAVSDAAVTEADLHRAFEIMVTPKKKKVILA